MKSYKIKKILRIGMKYRKGIITHIKSKDYGWIITIKYKKHNTQIFVYLFDYIFTQKVIYKIVTPKQ